MAEIFADLLARKFSCEAWIDHLPVGLYACDRDGRIRQFNRRAVEIWGREPGLGDTDQRFCGAFRLFRLDGSELPHAKTPMADVLATGRAVRDAQVRILRPDGSSVIVLVDIDPIEDAQGRLAGAVNCMRDVTELHRAREAAADEKRRLHDVLEALPAAVYTTDAEGRLTFYNRASVDLAGRRPELGEDRWCISWRLSWPDGTPMPHDECPMAISLRTRQPIAGVEAAAERPDGSRVPFLAYPTPLFDEAGQLLGAVNMLVDITERKRAESGQQLLINELNHRVKNTLSTVQSIARQTLRRSSSPGAFVESFGGRVGALAAAHTVLTREAWRGAGLRELVEDQLVLDDSEAERVALDGPAVTLGAQAALHLALVLHELGTNARKYGALSVPEGRLAIAWNVESRPARTLRITWRETGGPPVSAPARRGFGSTLIEKSLKAHGGEARCVYGGDGLRCEISIALPEEARPEAPPAEPCRAEPAIAEAPAAQDPLAGRRVLVVEDEPFLALDIETMLSDAGCTVVGPAQGHDEAMALAEREAVDLALLDANLAGRPVDDIAAVLTRRGVPFAFASGYGREGLPRAFRDAPLVSKPFAEKQLVRALRRLLEVDGEVTRIGARRSGAD